MNMSDVDMHLAACAAAQNPMDPRAADLAEERMSLKGQLSSLKPWTTMSLLALGMVVLALGCWHWQIMLIVISMLTCTLGQLVRWWHKNPSLCPLDHLLSSFSHGLFGLSIFAMGSALLVSLAVFSLTLPILEAVHLFDKHTWGLGLLLLLTLFWGSFCFVEDLWLMSALRAARARRQHTVRGDSAHKTFALYATASAVGYATAQCVALTCIVTAIMEGHTAFELHEEKARAGEITRNEAGFLFVLAMVFTWFWLPLRLMASHINALELASNPEHSVEPDGACCAGCVPYILPLPVAKETDGGASASGCTSRFGHLFRVIQWPWMLRTAHFVQFMFWFFLLVDIHLFLWLGVSFLTWLAIIFVAYRRVHALEIDLDPLKGDLSLRSLYGFALLQAVPQDGDDSDMDVL